MKTAASLPNEAKPPVTLISLIFISSLAKRLHSFVSPERGDFIEKSKSFDLLFSWWAIRDSNPGPTGYEPVALTN